MKKALLSMAKAFYCPATKGLAIFLVIILFTVTNLSTAFAANRYAVATGNWNATSTWSATSGGASGASIPVEGDVVTIGENGTNYNVTIPAGYSAACTSVEMGDLTDNTAATLTFSASTSSLTTSGNVVMHRPNAGATVLLSLGAGTMTVGGYLELSNHTSTATQVNRVSKITISTGTLAVAGDLIYSGQDNSSLQSQIVFSGAGTLNIGGNFTVTNGYGTLTPSTGTVVYNGAGNQNIAYVGLVTYNNLTINKSSGTASLTANMTVANLTLQSGTISASASNYSLSVSGNWVNNGGTYSGGTSTVSFTGATPTISGSGTTAFPNLSIGNTTAITMSSSNTCSSLTFASGATVASLTHSGTSTLTVNGDVTMNQPTAAVTKSWNINAGTGTVTGNIVFTGTTNTTTYIAKVAVTSGTLAVTGGVNWMANTAVATEVITVSTGTVSFGSSITMGSGSGTLSVTSTGTINFNGSSAPSFTLGGATGPVFTTTAGCTIGFANGFTKNNTSITFPATSTVNFAGTITPTFAITFGNVQVTGAGTMASGAAIIVAGNLTLASSSSLTLNQSMEVDGSWTNNGGALSGGSYTVTFNGTSQTIGGTSSTDFPAVQMGKAGAGAVTVSYIMNNDNTMTSLTFDGNTLPRSLTLGSGKTLTISGDLTVGQPTIASYTNLLDVSAGVCTVGGNIVYPGSSITTTKVSKVNVTSGTLNLTGTINWGTAPTATKVIGVSSGTVNFASSITMGSSSGTIDVTGAANVNFNGTTVPSLTFGGTTAPVFNTYSGSSIYFAKGFTQVTTALSFVSGANITVGSSNYAADFIIDPGSTITNNATCKVYGNLTSTSASAFVNGSNATLELKGNVSANVTLTATASGNTVKYNGTAVQAIKPTSYVNLTVDNTAGVSTSSGTTTVAGTLTLSNGVVTTTAANILKITSTGSASSGSTSAYVSGPLVKVGNSDFTFPIGRGGKWMRVGMSGLTTSTTQVTAEYFNTPYSDTVSFGSGISEISGSEYWMVDRTVTSDPVKLKFYWEDATASNIINCSNLKIAHYTGGAWKEETAAVVSGSSCSAGGSGSIELTGTVSSFSPFGFGGGGGALPIKLVSFDAAPKDNLVKTNWVTDLEINNAYFTLEKSKDAIDFKEVARVDGAGNSTSKLNYNYTDLNPFAGTSYYRLKQTDFDGQFTYSDIVPVMMSSAKSSFSIYPNPTDNELTLNVDNPMENISITIYDMTGRKMYARVFPVDKENSTHEITIQAKYLLPTGVYMMAVNTNGTEYRERIVLN